jgi:hypothetical protein
MQEVTIQIRFTRPCLGYAKQSLDKGRGVIYRMPRDGAARVMFLPSWWKNSFKFAAKVLGRYHTEAIEIVWSPPVTGTLSQWQRNIPAKNTKRRRYALHESFRPGTVVTLFAVLPADLAITDFTELLSIVGNYKGISPFQAEDDTYGTFDVVTVTPTERINLRDQK